MRYLSTTSLVPSSPKSLHAAKYLVSKFSAPSANSILMRSCQVIYDPNTDLKLWESGAIIQYFIDQYDTEKKLSYAGVKERNLCNQWLMFQMSQQGPFYGQISW